MAKPLASVRAKRMLSVLHLFEPGTRVPLESVADALGATVSEVVDDLDLLACCGIAPYTPEALVPVLVDGDAVIVWGELPALDRATRLSVSEAHAIVAALDVAGVSPGEPIVTKLLDAAASGEASAASFSQALRAAPEGGQPALRTIALALSAGRVLRLEYQSASAFEPSVRLVEPLSLVNERGAWYLEAFCRTAGALRTFRLDRVSHAEVLDERAERRRLSTSGSAFVADGLPLARVRLSPGEEVTEREWPGMRVVDSGSEGTLVDVPYAGTAWISRQVVARLGRAEVLEPPEVRAAVAALARQLADAQGA